MDDSYTRPSQGTGLGLTIAQRLVDLHGGEISVQSEPGVGSRFEISLPDPTERAERAAV